MPFHSLLIENIFPISGSVVRIQNISCRDPDPALGHESDLDLSLDSDLDLDRDPDSST